MRVTTRPYSKTRMIKQRTLGRTGLSLSELCLGTLNFGWKTDEKNAFAILDAYHAAGGNFIQAANYRPDRFLPSTAVTRSEEIVGRWWKSRELPRHELFFATRLYVRQPEDGNERDFIERVQDACRQSLRRFQTDYLDMVIFEWNEGLLPMRVAAEAFHHVVRNGLAGYIGAANFPTWRVVDNLGRAYLRQYNRIEALQSDYSLMTRTRFEPEAMALCQEQRLGFFAQSPLAGGFLTRRSALETMFHSGRRDWLMERFGNAYGETAQAAVADVATRHDASPAQVALAWVLRNPAVTSAVIGVHSVAQLNELVQSASLRLTADDFVQLDDATAAEEVRMTPEFTRPRVTPRDLMLN